ncbi:MAG TPA: hypothetical protein VLA89_06450 [Gemmatimonadales bacterium]|nr:hypothetical protein [Gemmatimonadales bacterium]
MTTETEPRITIKGENFSRSNRILRTLKMAQPIHAECQFPIKARWWVACEEAGHEPYLTKQDRLIETPVYGVDEEGDMVLQETKTKKKQVVRPNITQVALDESINDGRGVERFTREKGFKQLEDLGYQPMCQMFDCWLPVNIVCDFGEYCSKEHARLVGALVEEVALEVWDKKKRRAQLRAIELD